jgi:hypothetical protein
MMDSTSPEPLKVARNRWPAASPNKRTTKRPAAISPERTESHGEPTCFAGGLG